MPLDRKTVDRTSGEHIKMLQQCGNLSDKAKEGLRKMHEDIARAVERKHKDRSK